MRIHKQLAESYKALRQTSKKTKIQVKFMQNMEPIAQPTLLGQAARVHPAQHAAPHRLGADAAAAHAAGRTTP